MFNYNESLQMTFTSKQSRSSVITCKCGKSESFQLEEDSNPYVFTFTSPCCCPSKDGKCSGGGGGNGGNGDGLSLGSVLFSIGVSIFFNLFF
jgi:hypothetical protein